MSSNPFLEEDDKHKSTGWGIEDDYEEDEYDRKLRRIQEQKKQICERTLKSTDRSLGYIDESEKVGAQTGQELMAQREQIATASKNMDHINSDLNTSQRHLNSIKSVFYSIGTYFKKTPASEPKTSNSNDRSFSQSASGLEQTLANVQSAGDSSSSAHPGLRVHSDDTTLGSSHSSAKPNTYDEAINKNLDDMSVGMARLKGLALGMGGEIEEQNQMLDELARKVDRAQPKIEAQNRQMRKLLK